MKANKALAAILSASLLSGSLAYAPSALADEVSPNGKGMVGGGLLGAEAVTITLSLVGVQNGWAYLGGGVAGAVGGVIGGYFVEQNSSDGRAPVYMLAGGLALILPAVVLTLNATAYRGDQNATEDKAPTNIPPPADPGAAPAGPSVSPAPAPTSASPTPGPTPATQGSPGGSPAPGAQSPVLAPQSMIDVRPSRVLIGAPVIDVRNTFSNDERAKLGVNQVSQVHMSLLKVTF